MRVIAYAVLVWMALTTHSFACDKGTNENVVVAVSSPSGGICFVWDFANDISGIKEKALSELNLQGTFNLVELTGKVAVETAPKCECGQAVRYFSLRAVEDAEAAGDTDNAEVLRRLAKTAEANNEHTLALSYYSRLIELAAQNGQVDWLANYRFVYIFLEKMGPAGVSGTHTMLLDDSLANCSGSTQCSDIKKLRKKVEALATANMLDTDP